MTAVLVTRPAGRGDRLVAVLRAHGLRVHAVPTVAVVALADTTEFDRAIASIADYDWLVVTSVSGAEVLVERRPPGAPWSRPRPRLAAVGPATAAALAAARMPADLVGDQASASSLAEILARRTTHGSRILLLRADAATQDLPANLRAAGALVDDVVAYRTIEGPASSREPVRAALADPDLGCVVVTSGSAVRGLVALTDDVATLRDVPLVAIGRPTAVVARDAGVTVVTTAASPTTDGLLDAIHQSLDVDRLGVPA